jgi:preprotein translocase subunit YajC
MRGWFGRPGRSLDSFEVSLQVTSMSFFISDAMAEGAAASSQGDPILGLLFPIGLVVILYFFMIRPQVKRQKEHKKMVEAMGKGDEVVTAGGLVGRVMDLGEEFATLEVANGVQVKIRRAAVESILPKGSMKEM